jgi:hypothetical protein
MFNANATPQVLIKADICCRILLFNFLATNDLPIPLIQTDVARLHHPL